MHYLQRDTNLNDRFFYMKPWARRAWHNIFQVLKFKKKINYQLWILSFANVKQIRTCRWRRTERLIRSKHPAEESTEGMSPNRRPKEEEKCKTLKQREHQQWLKTGLNTADHPVLHQVHKSCLIIKAKIITWLDVVLNLYKVFTEFYFFLIWGVKSCKQENVFCTRRVKSSAYVSTVRSIHTVIIRKTNKKTAKLCTQQCYEPRQNPKKKIK